MAIRIEDRIEPNVTRMARISRLHPNNDPNDDPNRDEYGQMRRKSHRITRIRHRIVRFWPNLDPNNSRIINKKITWFLKRYIWVCRSCILTYLSYSAVFCSVFGWRFGWILGEIRGILGDSALFVLFGTICVDDSGRSSPYDTNKPESA